MPSVKNTIALVGAFATSVLAHGTVTNFTFAGVAEPGYKLDYYYLKKNGGTPPSIPAWSAENLDNGFIAPDAYGTVDINCHKNAAPGATSAKIAAGGKVDFLWSAWPESHIGPVLTYAAKCDGECTSADPATLKWVKIQEDGYDADKKQWAAAKLIADGNKWTATIPSDLIAGNYVLRHEIIALHGAGSENGAQNYPQCVNVEITGSGTANPEGTLGTALYKSTDAGILFNPYAATIDYTTPGPALFGSGSGSGSGSGATPATPSNGTSSAAPTASASAAAEDAGCSKKLRRHARDLFHARH
ncbi:glycosyl hydrolase family 61 [Colletotrichum karsti]|uniref:lytic cellulose monooxygenase (C4-dehydrogenating) n=1 Tax=Colletotrichum karsti TaxID=1095194 RepID=A0A9P6I257_9PEZI|nr:glycosyl hydrolase family 61 [Colletotrichum karsti]KAF9874430.1 glycosyl hydrolase family 61 [Colletotrichum karsti]